MNNNLRIIVKTLSYRTIVAISIFLAALLMNYSSGFGLTFVIASYTIGSVSFWIQEKIWNLFRWQIVDGNDTKLRSFTKTITWRIWSFMVLFIIGQLLGLSAQDSFEWTVVTNILFIVVHYVHERLWNRVLWGKKIEENEMLTA
jgi:uncharacterized membrane protein